MNVLVDEDTSLLLVGELANLLGPDGEVTHIQAAGWKGAKNGELLLKIKDAGYTHLITGDKKMANSRMATVPTLVIDELRASDLPTVRKTARSAALMLLADEPLSVDYHAVLVEGRKPSRRLRHIAEGRHRSSPAVVGRRSRLPARETQGHHR